MSKSSKIWLITFILSIWLLGARLWIVYSFHGAKPPALHLINFLLFIWLKLYSSFSLGNVDFPVFGRPRLLELWLIIIYGHLNYLILSVSVFVTADLKGGVFWHEKMKQKLICQDQIVRRWNYCHQDQSESNVGERSSWQGNEQSGFYTAFGRAKIYPNFLVDLASHGSLLSRPTGGKLKQEREKKNVTTIKKPRVFLKGSIHVWSAASGVQVADTILM